MLRQCADAKFDRTQFIEMLNQFIGDDTDKAWRQATLRYKNRVSIFGKFANCLGNLDIFCQIEVMHALISGDLSNANIAVIRQTRNYCRRLVFFDVRRETFAIGRIERKCLDVIQAMRTGDFGCRAVDLVCNFTR